MTVGDNKCSPKAIEVAGRAKCHSPAEPSAVCCGDEAADTVDQCFFGAVARVLFAGLAAQADGQHTFVLAEILVCELVRPTNC